MTDFRALSSDIEVFAALLLKSPWYRNSINHESVNELDQLHP